MSEQERKYFFTSYCIAYKGGGVTFGQVTHSYYGYNTMKQLKDFVVEVCELQITTTHITVSIMSNAEISKAHYEALQL